MQILKWAVALLLGATLLGCVALVWVPVHRFAVTCQKVQRISCIIEQESSSGLKTWQIPLGDNAWLLCESSRCVVAPTVFRYI